MAENRCDQNAASATLNNPSSQSVENRRKASCFKRFTDSIAYHLEYGLYRLGKLIGTYPWSTIALCIFFSGICGLGFLNYEESTNQSKIWTPKHAEVLKNLKWVEEHFESVSRFGLLIVIDEDVLTPKAIQAMYDLYLDAKDTSVSGDRNHTAVCTRYGHHCYVNSILELWSYNESTIRTLSREQIISDVNSVIKSPVYYTTYDVATVLGDITRDVHGNITSAKASLIQWFLNGDDKVINETEKWELELIKVGKQGHKDVENTYVYATRSFEDEGIGAVLSDTKLLAAGYAVLLFYVAIVLGKCNLLEHRIFLSLAGILAVGLSIVVSYGLASAIGMKYGPLHGVLPFLFLGIGVDDMFVIMGTWGNQHPKEASLPHAERVALMLKHAGVSVTVTSVTDAVAFGIGATTVLPGLQSFCIFAAIGILSLYILQATFFVACVALDQRRIDSGRDACILCFKHKNYKANCCSQREITPIIFKKFLAPLLMKLPVKILVILLTAGVLAVNIYGVINLKQNFDITLFLPKDSYSYKFRIAREEYFPDDGLPTSIYCSDINYYSRRYEMDKLYADITSNPYTYNGTVDSWYTSFTTWMADSKHFEVTSLLDATKFPVTDKAFDKLIVEFIQAPEGLRHTNNLKITRTPSLSIQASRINLKHRKMSDSTSEIRAMDSIRQTVSEAGFTDGKCFAYSRDYLSWETNKVIQMELYRNLGLAFVAVFVVTLILIANLWTCTLVATCVVFTLVNMGGTLYFWGLTIDTVTSVMLILAIGLAIDYSAHVGHTFMTINGTRNERALKTLCDIGPAVFNGGFSTFLAFILLAASNSYVFQTFFKVFFSVVVYGLFHGLIYLPVILSWIGPAPYLSAEEPEVLISALAMENTKNGKLECCNVTMNDLLNEKLMDNQIRGPPPDYDVIGDDAILLPAAARQQSAVECSQYITVL